jgi:hypothetical protein
MRFFLINLFERTGRCLEGAHFCEPDIRNGEDEGVIAWSGNIGKLYNVLPDNFLMFPESTEMSESKNSLGFLTSREAMGDTANV